MKKLIYAYAEKPLALIPLVLILCVCLLMATYTYVEIVKLIKNGI